MSQAEKVGRQINNAPSPILAKQWSPRTGAAKKEAENRTTKPGSQIGSGEKINPPSFGEPFEIEFFYRLVVPLRIKQFQSC